MTHIPVSHTQAGRNTKKSAHSRSRRCSCELLEAKQIIFAVIASAAHVATESLTQAEPIPKHTSILTGRAWLDEPLHGHPDQIKEQLGVSKHVFS
jgi:hypothetical protein